MCTALNFTAGDHYFGRTLDLDASYGEKVCVLPRNWPLTFRRKDTIGRHPAILGMAAVMGGTPLLYDGVNEHGLCMAGLNFPGNAYYGPERADRDSITPFEFMPWILGQCATVAEARGLLARLNLIDLPFAPEVPLSPLHWMISDRKESVVVESMKDGLHIHDNPTGVMTNNPPLPYHLAHLGNFRALSPKTSPNHLAPALEMPVYCQGLGALGLPGDVSSMSRFVRAVFHRQNARCPAEEFPAVSQVFHLMGAVEMPRGSCITDAGHPDITVYTACISADKGRYYYTTYDNHQITCVDMHRENLDGNTPIIHDLIWTQQIHCQN